MFKEMLTKQNLAMAGAATVAVMLTLNMTAGKSKLIQGAIALAAAGLALQLAKKVA